MLLQSLYESGVYKRIDCVHITSKREINLLRERERDRQTDRQTQRQTVRQRNSIKKMCLYRIHFVFSCRVIMKCDRNDFDWCASIRDSDLYTAYMLRNNL